MWFALRQAHDYWEDPPRRRRCVSRPVGNIAVILSFSCWDPHGPQQSSTNKRHKQDWQIQNAAFSELGTGTRPELGESVVTESTHIKRAPHMTVPKGRGPRLSRHVKADLRYGTARVVWLFSPTHVVFRPENPTLPSPPIPQVPPSWAWRYVLSGHYDTALRETSQATVPGVRPACDTCSALLPQAARGYPSVCRVTQATSATATGSIPRTRRLCRQLLSIARPKPLLSCGWGRPLLRSAEGPVPWRSTNPQYRTHP
jgi:hypothetical protein